MNVGGGQVGENGLPDNRIYNHINIQPVVHLEPGGQTAKGRWRAFAMFGTLRRRRNVGRRRLRDDVREGRRRLEDREPRLSLGLRRAVLDGLGAARAAPPAGAAAAGRAICRIRRIAPRNEACGGFPAACVGPFHYTNPGVTDAGHVWTTVDAAAGATAGAPRRASALRISRRARSGSPTSRKSRTCKRSTATTSIGACGTRSRICSPTTARSRWACAASMSARPRVREFLNLLGPVGLKDGELYDHVQLQVVVHVAPDGRSAKIAQPRAQHDRRVREPRRMERRRLREHVRQGQRRLEDQGSALLPDVHLRLRQRLGRRRAARADGERRAAAGSAADERLRDLSEGAHPAVSLRQPRERRGAALSRGARPAERRRDRGRARARGVPRAARGRQPQTDRRRACSRRPSSRSPAQGLPRDRQPDERVRLLPRQEPLERSRESVRRRRLDRARAARRLHRPRARARVLVQRVRQGRSDRRTGSATTCSTSP